MGNTCTGLVTKSWYAQAFSSAFTSSAFPKPAATSQTSPDNNNHELDSAPRDKVQHYPPAPNCIPASVHTNHDPQQVKEVIDVTMTKEGEAIKFPGHDLTASVLHRHTENVKDFYTVGRKLGQGQFGVTDLCAEKSTGKEFACKLIAKRKLISMEDVDDVQHELCIMHHLSGHPNIVTIKGPYEDVTSVHLVMGLCAGGELFDRIIQRGHYFETKAAELTQTIVGVIEACHSLGVMHRDLKPENFLFSNQGEDAALNTTDFGLSIFFKPGEIFTGVVGSPYYVAPEVLQKNMGQKQMCGVQELSSTFNSVEFRHFGLKLSKGFLSRFLKSELDFVSDPWPKIAECKGPSLENVEPKCCKEIESSSSVVPSLDL